MLVSKGDRSNLCMRSSVCNDDENLGMEMKARSVAKRSKSRCEGTVHLYDRAAEVPGAENAGRVGLARMSCASCLWNQLLTELAFGPTCVIVFGGRKCGADSPPLKFRAADVPCSFRIANARIISWVLLYNT